MAQDNDNHLAGLLQSPENCENRFGKYKHHIPSNVPDEFTIKIDHLWPRFDIIIKVKSSPEASRSSFTGKSQIATELLKLQKFILGELTCFSPFENGTFQISIVGVSPFGMATAISPTMVRPVKRETCC